MNYFPYFLIYSSITTTNHHTPPSQTPSESEIRLSILNNSSLQTLWLLDVDSLDIRVQLLLGALLVVTLTADTDTETERNALDTGFPDLLVQLGVEADVTGALFIGVLATVLFTRV